MLIPDEGTPQRMLKSILLGAPSSSHRSYRGDAVQSPEPRDDGEGTSRSRRGPVPVPVQAELSASHVLKERRRREKLNERFLMLRSLVPFVTKVRMRSIASSFTVVLQPTAYSKKLFFFSPVRRWTGPRS